ncbi:MAG: HDOD domain-containing protein [Betaproteobacteria bacterium]|nr:HDOD domain-containing protein [Betaproteobacteria bacterium]
MESAPAEKQDRELLAAIEEYLAGEGNFGIDPQVLAILDDLEASKSEIASIENLIDEMIAIRLRKLAGAVFRGMTGHGKPKTFNDVIASLGTQPAKNFIIAIALFSRLGTEHVKLETGSCAVSLFAKMIAEQMGFDRSAVEKAALGGLFLNLGKIVIAMYQSAAKIDIDAGFAERHQRYLASKIIAQFNLPEFLEEMIREDTLVLQRRSFSVTGIVFLAQALVDRIIDEAGVIRIKSPMPEGKDNLEVSLGSMFFEYFIQIGLGRFVKIIPC